MKKMGCTYFFKKETRNVGYISNLTVRLMIINCTQEFYPKICCLFYNILWCDWCPGRLQGQHATQLHVFYLQTPCIGVQYKRGLFWVHQQPWKRLQSILMSHQRRDVTAKYSFLKLYFLKKKRNKWNIPCYLKQYHDRK